VAAAGGSRSSQSNSHPATPDAAVSQQQPSSKHESSTPEADDSAVDRPGTTDPATADCKSAAAPRTTTNPADKHHPAEPAAKRETPLTDID